MTDTAPGPAGPLTGLAPWLSPATTTYTLSCPSLDTSPHIARDFVASVLRALGLDALVDAAALCTSELVTNACVHAKGGGSVLRLAVESFRVRVIVYDGDENPPVMREPTAGGWEEGGRGLHLVDALTEGHWGTSRGDGRSQPDGKAVWFDLKAPGGRHERCPGADGPAVAAGRW
ncbi:ATP-binding protein [Streptomyces scabiei]|uniref:ATP-binding protein n=1 Tax=Streptomyces scabiei TaxID=1930 RepID=UPI0038F6F407